MQHAGCAIVSGVSAHATAGNAVQRIATTSISNAFLLPQFMNPRFLRVYCKHPPLARMRQ